MAISLMVAIIGALVFYLCDGFSISTTSTLRSAFATKMQSIAYLGLVAFGAGLLAFLLKE
jgi:hypothetical protein